MTDTITSMSRRGRRTGRIALTGALAAALVAGTATVAQASPAHGHTAPHARSHASESHPGHAAHGKRRVSRAHRAARPIVSGRRRILPVATKMARRSAGGGAYTSPDGRYKLAMQGDGNLVLRDTQRRAVVWDTQTDGNPGARAIVPQADGNLVVYSAANEVLYTSATQSRGARLAVQNDGNVVLYSKAGKAIWSSHDAAETLTSGQTLRPRQWRRSADGSVRLVMQDDGNLVLRSGPSDTVLWSSQTNGHPGATATMTRGGSLVVAMPGSKVPLYGTASRAAGARLTVQNDGNAVVYSPPGTAQWSSHDDVEVLGSGQTLQPGQYRTSDDGVYRLQMQPDGNLVFYVLATRRALWASNTFTPGSRAQMQPDGNLTVVTPADQPVFATRTASAGARLTVQADGNIVIYSTARAPLWARGLVAPLG